MPLFRRRDDHGFGNQFSIGKYIAAPFQFLLSLLGGSDQELGQQVPLHKKIWRGFLFVLWFPFWLLFQFGQFVIMSWTTTRDGGAALYGALPMLGILGVVGILVASNFLKGNLTRRIHRLECIAAEENDDFEKAILCSRRVVNISKQPNWRFIHALTLRRSGMEQNSLGIMGQLADPDVKGHEPAHLYIAQDLLADLSTEDPEYESRLATARKHLERIQERNPDHDSPAYKQSVIMLAQIMFLQGDVDRAMGIYDRISAQVPQIIPDLAKYLIEKNRIERAQFHITRGVESIRRAAEVNPNQPQLWSTLHEILMVNNDYQAALDELNFAHRKAKDAVVKSQIRKLQSDVLVDFANTAQNIDTRDGFRRKLLHICRAVETYPRNENAIREFIGMVLYPEHADASQWLDAEALDNVNPALFHVIYGIRDAVQGKPVTSKGHLKLAFDGDSRTAFIINDVAFLLSFRSQQHYDALRLINVAVDTWPSAAKLYQTRGEIFVKIGRYEDARLDLEYAVKQLPQEPRAFEVLGDCYEKLGRDEDAAEYRAIAKRIRLEIEEKVKQYRERVGQNS